MARFYREAPLNAIWEGSGNVMALDVLRQASRQPQGTVEVIDELARAASDVCDVRELIAELKLALSSNQAERQARLVCERLARLGAVAAMVESESPFAGVYANTRLVGTPLGQFGTHELGHQFETELMDRALAV